MQLTGRAAGPLRAFGDPFREDAAFVGGEAVADWGHGFDGCVDCAEIADEEAFAWFARHDAWAVGTRGEGRLPGRKIEEGRHFAAVVAGQTVRFEDWFDVISEGNRSSQGAAQGGFAEDRGADRRCFRFIRAGGMAAGRQGDRGGEAERNEEGAHGVSLEGGDSGSYP